jgi:DNA-directed RNA polymerase II subunit RPB3
MKIELIRYDPAGDAAGDAIEFRMTDVGNSLANGLRRVLLSEIPTLATCIVDVQINTSVFHDEFLTHRIGLMPLRSHGAWLADIPFPHECSCAAPGVGNAAYIPTGGCERCMVQCEVDVMCPLSMDAREVTSADFVSTDPRFAVAVGVHPIPICKLGRGQRFKAVCFAKKGIAKQHARHMAVGTVSYRYEVDIRMNRSDIQAMSDKLRQEWVARCPADVYEIVGDLVEARRPENCILCRECMSIEPPFDALPAPLVSVKPLKNAQGHYNVLMRVESVGCIPAAELVKIASRLMRGKLTRVRDGLEAARQIGGPDAAGPGAAPPASATASSTGVVLPLRVGGSLPPTQAAFTTTPSAAVDDNDLLQLAAGDAAAWS